MRGSEVKYEYKEKGDNMAGIGIMNWNELEKAGRSGYYRRRAHREEANKKLERAKKLKPKTYNLKPTGGRLK